jgi:hypothetical protein
MRNLKLPWLYLKLIIPIIFVFLALSLTVRALGYTQPSNTLRGFVEDCEGKPQPCWYGITLDSINIPKILSELYFTYQEIGKIDGTFLAHTEMGCAVSMLYIPRNGSLTSFSIMGCGARVGELIEVLGNPDYVDLEMGQSTQRVVMRYVFDKRVIEIRHYFTSAFSPDSLIQQITFTFCDVMNSNCQGVSWRGYLTAWDYCKLDAECRMRLSNISQFPPALSTLPPG